MGSRHRREIVVVGDSGFAALELLSALARHKATAITRLRLEAALYDPAPPRLPGTNGRPRTKGAQLPNLSEVLRGSDTRWQSVTVPGWFVQRWQLEVTFQETRAHLDFETQRQWSDLAIARTTLCLLALFSLVTLLTARLGPAERRSAASSAWYRKPRPTFSDTLAAVRRHIWREQGLLTSRRSRYVSKPRPALQRALAYAICHAA